MSFISIDVLGDDETIKIDNDEIENKKNQSNKLQLEKQKYIEKTFETVVIEIL